MKEESKNTSSLIKILIGIIVVLVIIVFLLLGWKITKVTLGGVELAPPETPTKNSAPDTSPISKTPTSVQPTQNFISPPRKLTSADYGAILYEDNFDTDTAIWSLQKGSQIQNGGLILSPGEDTIPSWNTKYSDYIFETSFQFFNIVSTDYSGMSVYLRYVPCSGNCSSQVGVSTKGEVFAWNKAGTYTKQILPRTVASEFNFNGSNKLTVIVNGKEFQIFLNDVFVRSFDDSTYKSGIIALDVDGASIAFDYVRIYAVP